MPPHPFDPKQFASNVWDASIGIAFHALGRIRIPSYMLLVYGYLLYQLVKWVRYVTLPCCSFQVSAVLYFSFMMTEKWEIHLDRAYPDCCFWENGMQHHLIFLHIFSARCMYAFPSSLMMTTFLPCSLSEYTPVCTSYHRSSEQCFMMLDLRLSMYDLLHPGRRLLRHQLASQTILMGLMPINDSIEISRMKAWWLPMMYLNGITHALLMLRSLDIHGPPIGLEPRRILRLGLFLCAGGLLLVGPILLCLPAPSLELHWSCVCCSPWKESSYPLLLTIVWSASQGFWKIK